LFCQTPTDVGEQHHGEQTVCEVEAGTPPRTAPQERDQEKVRIRSAESLVQVSDARNRGEPTGVFDGGEVVEATVVTGRTSERLVREPEHAQRARSANSDHFCRGSPSQAMHRRSPDERNGECCGNAGRDERLRVDRLEEAPHLEVSDQCGETDPQIGRPYLPVRAVTGCGNECLPAEVTAAKEDDDSDQPCQSERECWCKHDCSA
jgi:hypothetical protein